jgi:hypothetical protein
MVNVTLADFQLDAQNSYLFTYNTFIKLLYMFRALPCSSSGGLRRNCLNARSTNHQDGKCELPRTTWVGPTDGLDDVKKSKIS